MKSVLISIQPKWCELIASGKKTVEVRKTRPKIETPFKVYIYETQGRTETPWMDEDGHEIFKGRGQVIGEFVCKNITYIDARIDSDGDRHLGNTLFLQNRMCLSNNELFDYLYKGENENNGGWAWHISDLVIYHGLPKELSEFERACPDNVRSCAVCRHSGYSGMKCLPLKKPPQSWCYVESLKGE